MIVAELALAQYSPLPRLDLRKNVGEKAEPIVRRQDWNPDHVPERHQHEQRFHGRAKLDRLLGDLVPSHPIDELVNGLLPGALVGQDSAPNSRSPGFPPRAVTVYMLASRRIPGPGGYDTNFR